MQSEENPLLWMYSDDNVPQFAVRFDLQADAVELQMIQVGELPIDDKLLGTLLSHWTDWGVRMQVQGMLQQVGLEESVAEQLAVQLRTVEELRETPKHAGCLRQEVVLPDPDKHGERVIGSFDLFRNDRRVGWLRLALVGERLQTAMSIVGTQERDAYGYLSGSVHPRSGDGCIFAAAAFLAGWPLVPSGEARALEKRLDEGGVIV